MSLEEPELSLCEHLGPDGIKVWFEGPESLCQIFAHINFSEEESRHLFLMDEEGGVWRLE